jgi:hypothetical protein
MATDDANHQMWKKLGIDMAKHDQLLTILPDIYKQVYITSQKNRPQNMGFFEFVVGDIHGIRVKELVQAKADGKMIVGSFCLYVPDEIILALNGVNIGLCGGTNFSNFAVEGLLPTNTCALIKSALGFGLGKICPYYAIADILIGETTCDGKKKAWEILAKHKNVYVMETPQLKNRPQSTEGTREEARGDLGQEADRGELEGRHGEDLQEARPTEAPLRDPQGEPSTYLG